MKKMWCVFELIPLLVAVLFRTVAVVLSQDCPLESTCAAISSNIPSLRVVAVGTKERLVTCNPTNIMMGDTFQWYFTRTVVGDGDVITRSDKYNISGQMNQTLVVNNITSSDEGLYFCRTLRGDGVLSEILLGACLYAYSPAQFDTCSGENNDPIPQEGCSGVEMLSETQGGSAVFNIGLSHMNMNMGSNCFSQRIESVTFSKDGTIWLECSDDSCNPRGAAPSRLNQTISGFNITVTLHDLEIGDGGAYNVSADIRDPANLNRVCIYKNFLLEVKEVTTMGIPPGPSQTTISPTTTSGSQQGLSSREQAIIFSVIAVLVILLLVLGAVVTVLLLWTYRWRKRSLTKNRENSDYYAELKDVSRRDKKGRNGVSATNTYSHSEDDQVTLDPNLNSPEIVGV